MVSVLQAHCCLFAFLLIAPAQTEAYRGLKVHRTSRSVFESEDLHEDEALRRIAHVADGFSSVMEAAGRILAHASDEDGPEVARPDINLNEIFKFFWPHVSRSLEDMLQTYLMPVLKDLPMLGGLRITSLDLHSDTPSLELVELRKTDGRHFRATVKFEHNISKPINMGLGPITLGVANVVVAGEVIVRLDQLLDTLPIVGGLAIQFADTPVIKYEVTGLLAVTKIPGIRRLIDGAVDSVISSYFLGPNRFAYSWSNAVDFRALRHPPPAGLLRVVAGDGHNLASALTTSLARAPDEVAATQIDVQFGGQVRQFSRVDGDSSLLATGSQHFMIWDEGQRVRISAWDTIWEKPTGFMEDFGRRSASRRHLGNVERALPVREAVLHDDPQRFNFEGKLMSGELTLGFKMLYLTPSRRGDVYVLRAEIDRVILPRSEGVACKVVLEIGEGSNKIELVTQTGYEQVTSNDGAAVTAEKEEVIRAMKAYGQQMGDIAEILKISRGAVESVLNGGSSKELRPILADIWVDSILYTPIDRDLVDGGATIKITVVTPTGRLLEGIASPSKKLSDLEFGFVAPYKTHVGAVDCMESGWSYEPVNMPGEKRSDEKNVLSCQTRCITTEHCAHFSYWTNGGCHLQDSRAVKVRTRGATAGPARCLGVDAWMSLSLLGTQGSFKARAPHAHQRHFAGEATQASSEAHGGVRRGGGARQGGAKFRAWLRKG